MKTGLATLTIKDTGESEDVTYKMDKGKGRIFGNRDFLQRALSADHVDLSFISTGSKMTVKVGRATDSGASFEPLPQTGD